MRILPLLFILFLIASCKQDAASTDTSKNDYYSYGDSIEAGGVRMIPITTPAGNFKVWTKRFGNNPTIKILLLHAL